MLGLPPRPSLTDDDVRAAWRRIAAATHPDREDGGDPARFGAAAAAYALLRTGYGRGEALADLGPRGGRHRGPRDRTGWRGTRDRTGSRGTRDRTGRRGRFRGRRGRPAVLTARLVTAAGIVVLALVAAGWAPASIGVMAGALTWLVATGRHDLPPGVREWEGPGQDR